MEKKVVIDKILNIEEILCTSQRVFVTTVNYFMAICYAHNSFGQDFKVGDEVVVFLENCLIAEENCLKPYMQFSRQGRKHVTSMKSFNRTPNSVIVPMDVMRQRFEREADQFEIYLKYDYVKGERNSENLSKLRMRMEMFGKLKEFDDILKELDVEMVNKWCFEDYYYLSEDTIITMTPVLEKTKEKMTALLKAGYDESVEMAWENNLKFAPKQPKCNLPLFVPRCHEDFAVFNKDVILHIIDGFVTLEMDGLTTSYAKGGKDIYVCSPNTIFKKFKLDNEKEKKPFKNVRMKIWEREKLEENFNCFDDVVVQGIICGPNINANPHGFKRQEFFIFDVYIDGKRLDHEEVIEFCKTRDLKMVPTIGKWTGRKTSFDFDRYWQTECLCLHDCQNPSTIPFQNPFEKCLCKKHEEVGCKKLIPGIVIRPWNYDMSFRLPNPAYKKNRWRMMSNDEESD
jgi:hypothetical protein